MASAKNAPSGCAISFDYCNDGSDRGNGCEFICPIGNGAAGGLPYEGVCHRNSAAIIAKTGVRNYCSWP
ncbi:hypothetical protein HBI56_222410 [Parastagonospora nodorum]|uniref:Uncharacterized protein n=1 Tax=Phaeosphaeria nodorum (strain SN15 / ATCC MYA-4574 / FGSC 10173) TaxID=321614 RepID=A0A7U2IDI1_PHANO|nr:hypothetical protein HBH56_231640 [Parastagonospora nodorum]QRD07778.1 hypothetical protein JI435_161660 [Parastagonospora nodorum SN15]KAH3921451.1 hypothetical protein HBH54_241440 [Parastagonospora nodorum]KAH3939972.1 hypothetical protein HBH53_224730 [Parastagonospora nodorum]KAH3956968.1 hypothetical protein HBH51_231350 [Parastagonospora nodorum]